MINNELQQSEERQEQAAQLNKQEAIIELKKYLAYLCELGEKSKLIIFDSDVYDDEYTLVAFKKANMELIELFCERLQVQEHIQKDFNLPEYYYRYSVSVSV